MEYENFRFYIMTRTLLEVDPTTIHEELVTAYGAHAVSYSTVQRWSKKTHDGEMEIEDNARSGRPVTETTPENIDLIRSLIEEDPHSTYDELEAETQLSRGTIFNIIHDHLKLRKITSRWVPHKLTLYQKQERVRICRENLAKIQSGSWRTCNIITGDETWIYYRQLRRKASNAHWVSKGQSPKTVVRRSNYEPKMLFSIFFRSNGWLWIHAVDSGETVDGNYYINNCLGPVIEEIKKQRPNSGVKGIKLLHDNAKPHVASEVKTFLKEEGINVMPHPPYSPDLSPCDFWLFDYIKRNLEDQTDEDSLFKAVTKIVKNISEKEYKKTFDRLVERMQLCIDNKGEYFEHLLK